MSSNQEDIIDIKSSFFKNIKNLEINPFEKFKSIFLSISQKNFQHYLHNIFLKLKELSIKEENGGIKEEVNEFDTNFFDSCLSLKEHIMNKDITNKEDVKDSQINVIDNKSQDIILEDKKVNLEKYDDNIVDNGDNNNLKNSKNDYHDINNNNNDEIINNNNDKYEKNSIEDFDVKFNEEIINSKNNFGIKSDIFELNYETNSLNNSKINNISTIHEADHISLKETDTILEPNDNNNKNELNELCNIFNEEPNFSEINHQKDNQQIPNGQEIIKKENLILKNDFDNNKKSINKPKKFFFDSLENNNLKFYTIPTNNNYTTNDVNNKVNKIRNKKLKLLKRFMNGSSDIISDNKYSKCITPRKNIYQISQTNNIILNKNNNEENNTFNTITCTDKNIVIKGIKYMKNIPSNNGGDNNGKNNLKLPITDRKDNVVIKEIKNFHSDKDKNKKQNLYNVNNNIQDRIINSKMIMNFLNNSKNEPMFSINNFNIYNIENEQKVNDKNIYSKYKIFEENKNDICTKNDNMLKAKMEKLNKTYNNLNDLIINERELIEPNVQICPVTSDNRKGQKSFTDRIFKRNSTKDLRIKNVKSFSKNKKIEKSFSTDLTQDKILKKYNSNKTKGKRKSNNNSSIHNELINFINSITNNNNNENKDKNLPLKDVYDFKSIKNENYNTYRADFNRKNRIYKKNQVINNKAKVNKDKFGYNLNIRKNLGKNFDNVSNKNKKNVDYKRLNELYLDYKLQNIKRNNLKKEQDAKNGINFWPNFNKK